MDLVNCISDRSAVMERDEKDLIEILKQFGKVVDYMTEPNKQFKKEIWKNIDEIEGLEECINYQISTWGRVKSLKGNGKILSSSSGNLQ